MCQSQVVGKSLLATDNGSGQGQHQLVITTALLFIINLIRSYFRIKFPSLSCSCSPRPPTHPMGGGGTISTVTLGAHQRAGQTECHPLLRSPLCWWWNVFFYKLPLTYAGFIFVSTQFNQMEGLQNTAHWIWQYPLLMCQHIVAFVEHAG